jgi:hypothetical protein
MVFNVKGLVGDSFAFRLLTSTLYLPFYERDKRLVWRSSARGSPPALALTKGLGKMQFEGSVIREQGVTFAIVIVKPHVLDSTDEANRMARSFLPVFGPMPIILMAQDSRGTPTWYGRRDIVNFLRNVPISAIPWKKYALN